MAVIAMTREMGSMGKEVADRVARELGLSAVYDEIVDNLACKMGFARTRVARLIEGRAGRLERWRTRGGALNLHARADLLEVALKGNVLIRGWGATYLLRTIKHIPRIRVCAPLPRRVRFVQNYLDFNDENRVLAEIARSDCAYASSLRMSNRPNSSDPWHYDLVLDSEKNPLDYCVAEVLRLARQPEFQETQASRTTLANMALRTRILATLKGAPRTASARINAVATQGAVMLLGMVGKVDDVRAIEELVATVPGVKTLRNELRPIHGGAHGWRSAANF